MENSKPNKADFNFKHTLRVRWAEVDAQAIVFNGHYLMYFDVSITEYFRNIGLTFPEGITKYGSDLFVKKSSVEYHAPARFDDFLDIYVRVARLGNSSIQFLLEIFREEQHLISGEVIYVNADLQSHQSAPIPIPLREKIVEFEKNLTQ